ncbi:MAG: VacB/RNase II family 3'-5' exoribonuclease [Leptonema sp. (in: Bacteria)]|nr:VacB/RNase II family 3'-5' exoribonuclease [Leptonema sp. (in: bacteria)]
MNAKQILRFLNERHGQNLSHSELYRLFKQSGRVKSKSTKFDDLDVATFISDLELLQLIQRSRRSFQIRSPFFIEAKASMNPAGIIFAMPRMLVATRRHDNQPRDIFIPPSHTLGAMSNDTILVRITDRKKDRFEGEVVSVIKRARRFYRFRVDSIKNQTDAKGVLLDTNASFRASVNIGGLSIDSRKRIKAGTVLVVELLTKTNRDKDGSFHTVKFIRFADDTEFDTDFDRILLKYNLDPYYEGFDFNKVDPDIQSQISDWSKRKDLRKLYTITIDGADSKDFDDALSYEVKSKRKSILYVHIADVSFYVTKDSDLDKEARERATSYYIGNRVVPMLPPALSENLCSLMENHNRLAITAEMTIDQTTGQILSSKFYRSIIRVDKRYTYQNSEAELDSTANDPILADLWKLASAQKKLRTKHGRIDLELVEPSLHYQGDQITSISSQPRLKSSMLIEECMLSANISVAKYLRKKDIATLYRVHAPMDESKIDILNSFFDIYNIDFQLKDSKPESLQQAIQITSKKGSTETKIFNLLLLRSFMQAQYSPEPEGHWGLGFEDYCHFTSPIRRYPDLVVHRCLIQSLLSKKEVYSKDDVDQLAIHTSEKERQAMEAERDMLKLKLIRYIEHTGQTQFSGFITGIRQDVVYLELDEFPVEAVVPAIHLSSDGQLIQSDPFSVYIRRLSRPAFLGEKWQLELDRIDIEALRIYFKPIWPNSHKNQQTKSNKNRKDNKSKNQRDRHRQLL